MARAKSHTASSVSPDPQGPRLTPQVRATIGADPENDPVARQYLYDAREADIRPGESPDPIGDHPHSPLPGLVHRYPDRALLKLTDSCAVYCRFCFRKDMVGQGKGLLSQPQMEAIYAYLDSAPQVREVIFSGGDPLTLSNRRLAPILERLAAMPHLDILRFHTRGPVVQPGRIDADFCRMIAKSPKTVYLCLHINHAQEIDDTVRAALRDLRRSGAVLMSQTVLLRGINDSAGTLETLLRELIRLGVVPYQLHHPDLARGTAHFRLTLEEGRAIVAQLQHRLSGLARPVYVLDLPGGYGKLPIPVADFEARPEGGYIVTDTFGRRHLYAPEHETDQRG